MKTTKVYHLSSRYSYNCWNCGWFNILELCHLGLINPAGRVLLKKKAAQRGDKFTTTCERCGTRRDSTLKPKLWWENTTTTSAKMDALSKLWRKKQKKMRDRFHKRYIKELKRESKRRKKKKGKQRKLKFKG